MMHFNPYWGRRGAGLLLFSGNRVLLTLRSSEVLEPGTWGVPGGKAEHGEQAYTAALRETQEELGPIPPHVVFGDVVFEDGDFRYTTFLARMQPELAKAWRPRLNWENDEAEWFDVANLPEDDLHFGLEYVRHEKPALFASRMVKNMDEGLRTRERRLSASGDPLDRARVLADRLRAGLVTPEHLSVAGWLGDEAAALVVPVWKRKKKDSDAWPYRDMTAVAGEAPVEHSAQAHMAADMVLHVLPRFPEIDPVLRRAVEATLDWAACPCKIHAHRARKLERAAERFEMNAELNLASDAMASIARAVRYAAMGTYDINPGNPPLGHAASEAVGAVWSVANTGDEDGGPEAEAAADAEKEWQRLHMIAVLTGDLPATPRMARNTDERLRRLERGSGDDPSACRRLLRERFRAGVGPGPALAETIQRLVDSANESADEGSGVTVEEVAQVVRAVLAPQSERRELHRHKERWRTRTHDRAWPGTAFAWVVGKREYVLDDPEVSSRRVTYAIAVVRPDGNVTIGVAPTSMVDREGDERDFRYYRPDLDPIGAWPDALPAGYVGFGFMDAPVWLHENAEDHVGGEGPRPFPGGDWHSYQSFELEDGLYRWADITVHRDRVTVSVDEAEAFAYGVDAPEPLWW